MLDFNSEDLQSDNPFVDKLLKVLKELVLKCIVKDEYAADRAETTESINNAEVYMACMENRVSLVMFQNIPEQFLREVGLDETTIRLYKHFNYNVDVIPRDNDEIGRHYRADLVAKLRPWFLLNYEEKNEYYRMITGKPPIDEWGIPMRDYEALMPDGFTYMGEFVHEIGPKACRELEAYGILDVIKSDYPKAKYLNYLTAGLSPYDVRKSLDFMILWNPENLDYNITEEFLHRYQERREFLLTVVYNSAMEIESEHYHSTMQIFLFIMTMVDMLADIQTYMIKRMILDRRCIEFLFSMYSVPYYKEIPYLYQERIYWNLNNLLKYKASSENFEIIKKIFDMEDVEFFKYYLTKVRKRDDDGEFIYDGRLVKKSHFNDILKTKVYKYKIEDMDHEDGFIYIDYPSFVKEESNILIFVDGLLLEDYFLANDKITIKYEDVEDKENIDCHFFFVEEEDIHIIKEEVVVEVEDKPYLDMPEPFEDYIRNDWPFVVLDSTNHYISESKYDVVDREFNTYPTDDLSNRVYGDSIKFIFYYIEDTNHIYEEFVEDYDNDCELVFNKIPISDLYSSQYLLDEGRWKNYDMVIARDEWWLGKNYRAGNYEYIKKNIYEAPYNYFRAKYYGLGRIVEMSSNTARMTFFYSALFDDLFHEGNLNFLIPSLSSSHEFNLTHLFMYMTVLSQIYKGHEDINIEEVLGNYRVSGFNYHASLEDIKNYIIEQNYPIEYFEIWDFIIPDGPIESVEEFMNIILHNEEIYHYVRNKYINSRDYGEAKIWDYIYYNLMTWEFSQEFFKISEDKIAKTYTEFLKYKDPILYASIESIKAILDEELRIDTITNNIDDICYILEGYIDAQLSNYVFSEFVGHNTGSMLTYMIYLIELFKSHRIVLNERGEVLTVGSGGVKTINEDSVINYFDELAVQTLTRTYDYWPIEEKIEIKMNSYFEENPTLNEQGNYWAKEDCEITTYRNGREVERINV